MTLSETIVARVEADATFKTLAGGRIFAVQIPASTLAPLVVFVPVGGETYPTHDDIATPPGGDLRSTQIQFSTYGHTRTEVARLSSALHNAIHAGQSSAVDGYLVVSAEGPRESYEDAANLHRCDLDLTFVHSLTV